MFTLSDSVNVVKKLETIANYLNSYQFPCGGVGGATWQIKTSGTLGSYLFISIPVEGIRKGQPDRMPFDSLPNNDIKSTVKKLFTPESKELSSIDFTQLDFSYGTFYKDTGVQAYLIPEQHRDLFSKLYQLAEESTLMQETKPDGRTFNF